MKALTHSTPASQSSHAHHNLDSLPSSGHFHTLHIKPPLLFNPSSSPLPSPSLAASPNLIGDDPNVNAPGLTLLPVKLAKFDVDVEEAPNENPGEAVVLPNVDAVDGLDVPNENRLSHSQRV